MYRFAIAFAVLALLSLGVPHLAHADDSKHFEPGHLAMPTPSARATLSVDQRQLKVEHGEVALKLWVHNPTRRDIQTTLNMPLVGAAEHDSAADARQAFQKNYSSLSITHDDEARSFRTPVSKSRGERRLSVEWSATFPAHRTVEITVTYPFLFERHEFDQTESWSFQLPGAASNAWAGRVHYSSFRFCDSTIVGRIGDFGGDTRAWNSLYPEYFRDYAFTIRPERFRLGRYGKCMLWETEDQSPNGEPASFEVGMSKRWEKLTPFVPPGVEDEDIFLVRTWCAGGSSAAASMWSREHLAARVELTSKRLDDDAVQEATFAALERAHGGASADQLDTYWSKLPSHIRHRARIRVLEYLKAYLGKRTDSPVDTDFARACTGNVDSSVAPAATTVENRKLVDAMLAQERAAFSSAWRAIDEKY
ncbi:MAG: hypothetical protein ACQEVA_13410 [Myxococcota bacterium]